VLEKCYPLFNSIPGNAALKKSRPEMDLDYS
ncbi:MAG: hypothetical protein ACI8YW_001280, partial [Flavobacteriaceae bacterium]